eukprot:scaffold233846_cov22-Tisochrysis_lutea.AAC.2
MQHISEGAFVTQQTGLLIISSSMSRVVCSIQQGQHQGLLRAEDTNHTGHMTNVVPYQYSGYCDLKK